MSYRFMRMIVFFDLPTETNENKKNYRNFRKMLIQNGFVMMQESVYCRIVLNKSVEESVAATIKRNNPPNGIVQLLTITEKQFSKIEFICGEVKSDVLASDERLVIL